MSHVGASIASLTDACCTALMPLVVRTAGKGPAFGPGLVRTVVVYVLGAIVITAFLAAGKVISPASLSFKKCGVQKHCSLTACIHCIAAAEKGTKLLFAHLSTCKRSILLHARQRAVLIMFACAVHNRLCRPGADHLRPVSIVRAVATSHHDNRSTQCSLATSAECVRIGSLSGV